MFEICNMRIKYINGSACSRFYVPLWCDMRHGMKEFKKPLRSNSKKILKNAQISNWNSVSHPFPRWLYSNRFFLVYHPIHKDDMVYSDRDQKKRHPLTSSWLRASNSKNQSVTKVVDVLWPSWPSKSGKISCRGPICQIKQLATVSIMEHSLPCQGYFLQLNMPINQNMIQNWDASIMGI